MLARLVLFGVLLLTSGCIPTDEATPTRTQESVTVTAEISSPTPIPTATQTPELHELLTIIAEIPVGLPNYDRDDWRHWIDADGDCQDTRQEVLIEESLEPVVFETPQQCRVLSGRWIDLYTGIEVTDPRQLDIDHLVALGNAHISGGWAWDLAKKRDYANYLKDADHLIAVTASANRSKSDKSPQDWRPPNPDYWCEYAADWIRVKRTWELSATPAEWNALQTMLATCTSSSVEPPSVSTATPAPTPTPTPTLAVTSTPSPTQTVIPTLAPSPTATPPPTATRTPTPTPTPTTQPAARCDPSYPDVCIPPYPPDLDCGEIRYRNFRVLPPDPHGFDRDRDGIGCET